jgi:hypothetical protein
MKHLSIKKLKIEDFSSSKTKKSLKNCYRCISPITGYLHLSTTDIGRTEPKIRDRRASEIR